MINLTNIYLDKKIATEVQKVLLSKSLVQGEKVRELEAEMSKVNETRYAVVVNSGTAALHTALVAIGLREGDEVITTPFSFIATVNTILMCKAKPVFIDVNKETFTIDPDLIEDRISKKTKAIVTVDLYGQTCDYKKISKIAKKYNLKIISDSCQAIGAMYKSKPIAKWVDIACFSFYATKNIMMGEGGALVTNNRKVFEFAKRFRQHGQDMEKPYFYHHLGYNYRSTDILAVIGLSQIKFLKKWTKQRYDNACKLIKGLKGIPGIITPNLRVEGEHVFHQFTIRITKDYPLLRDQLRSYLFDHGVRSGVYYPCVLAEYPFIKEIIPYNKDMYPVAEELSSQVLSLPVHPMLKNSEIKKIVSLIKKGANEKN